LANPTSGSGQVGQDAFAVIRDIIGKMNLMASGAM